MAVMRRTLFEDLLRGGSELVLSYQETRNGWGDEIRPREDRFRLGMDVSQIAEQSVREFA